MGINTKRVAPVKIEKMRKEAHTNFMGAPSYDINNPLLKLRIVAASSFFGEPSYYKGETSTKRKISTRASSINDLDNKQREYLRGILNGIDDYSWRNLTPAETIERAVLEALDYDAEATLQIACELRNEDMIRTTPQVILTLAAHHKKVKHTGLIRKYAKGIIKRMDEPAVQLAYHLDKFKNAIPNSLKRAWMDAYKNAGGYHLSKYRMESRAVKTVDVINLAYGKGSYGFQNDIGKLMRGELKLGNDYKTWESIISSGGKWEEAIEVMGHMALLRNIRNLLENKVSTELWLKKLVDTAAKGKQLPFRYLMAHKMNSSAPGHVLDAIEECLEISVGNLPTFNGRSLVLTDNSGSAHGTPISELSHMTVAQIGNLMGVLTGKVSDEGVLGVFGDRLEYIPIRKKASIMDQTLDANKKGKTVGGGTENGVWLALNDAIRNKKHWDNIFVYSDMQAGHGGLYGVNPSEYRNYTWKSGSYHDRYIDVPKLIHDYRVKVNSKVNVFLVQIAGYEDTLLPEYYDRTYILGGWSGNILKFARKMIDIADEYQQ